jgi:hypothetical protein
MNCTTSELTNIYYEYISINFLIVKSLLIMFKKRLSYESIAIYLYLHVIENKDVICILAFVLPQKVISCL